MRLETGQIIIHPAHGPMQVADIQPRRFAGQLVPYVELVAPEQGLAVALPLARVDQAGLREVATPEQARAWLTALGQPPQTGEASWANRIKEYQARLATGRVEDDCFVLRQVHAAGSTPASVAGQLFRRAAARVGLELSLALGVNTEAAERLIQDALAVQQPAPKPKPARHRKAA